jgi:ATP phosphoribosyltransferase regulatory subunit
MPAWLLPDQIADLLPAQARKVELLRRTCLDSAQSFGYELVMPSLLEYADSLLTGTGRDLDLRTFKLTDQISGKTLGLRADITPQVARIDAHLLNRQGVARLCYAGSVLHTRAANALTSRELLQFGAEIYGHAGQEAEAESLELLLICLQHCHVQDVTVSLGDVRVLESLIEGAPLTHEQHDDLLTALVAKDATAIHELASHKGANGQACLSAAQVACLVALCHLYGNVQVIDEAKARFAGNAIVVKALEELRQLQQGLQARFKLNINIDFADLRGYHYYTATTFAIYVPGLQTSLARGGRYDAVGEAFGRSRPAVGFSMDLKQLALVSALNGIKSPIVAPSSAQPAALPSLELEVQRLRETGETVVRLLPGHVEQELATARQLKLTAKGWAVEAHASSTQN